MTEMIEKEVVEQKLLYSGLTFIASGMAFWIVPAIIKPLYPDSGNAIVWFNAFFGLVFVVIGYIVGFASETWGEEG